MINKSIKPSTSIIKQAFDIYGKSQTKFGQKIGKNQSQVSKYLSGEISPSADSIIQCMNIIQGEGNISRHCPATTVLQSKIQKLSGEQHKQLRKALNTMIDAYCDQLTKESDRTAL